jgi:WD40 repeat protein
MRQAPSYENFDVLLERASEGVYRARVVHAPAGQGARVTFVQPYAPLELENFLLRIGRPRRPVRRVDAPETRAIKAFGERLYRALFHDDLRVSLERSLSEAAAKGAGLRLRLRLSDTPELAELPWEFLYDRARNRFMCLSNRTPLVRFLEVPDPPGPLPVSPPLRVLVMISSPRDSRLAQLDVEQEWTKLHGVLGGLEQAGLVQLEAATLGALRQRLRRDDWHILHFIGHGGFDPHAQDGILVLEDPAGGSRLVSAQALGVPLHNHDPLRLVVLNACEGARADPTDPFAGTAQVLIQQGIPAVVAMQFEITDLAAITFTSELYAAVADGYPLDAALSQARQAIYTEVSEIEWATPVLYLRAPDGRIFDIAPTPPAATPLSPAASTWAPAAPTMPAPRPSATPAKPAVRPWSSKPVRTFRHSFTQGALLLKKTVVGVAFSPNARRLATASVDNTARIWDASSGKQLHSLTHTGEVRSVAFSPDGRWLATASVDNAARIWDASSGKQLCKLAHDNQVLAVAFGSDGRWLVTASKDNSARTWDASSGEELQALTRIGEVRSVAFSPDGRWLATVSEDNSAEIWDVSSGKQLRTVAHYDQVDAVAFSPDGGWLATASKDKTARSLYASSGKRLRTVAHYDQADAVAFSPDSRWLPTVSFLDNTVRIWDVSSGKRLRALAHHDHVLLAVAFSPDSRWLATATLFDSTVRIWDVSSGKQLDELAHYDPVHAVAFSPDGRWLATGTLQGQAVLWRLTPP